MEREFFRVVGSAWSLIEATCHWVGAILGFRHSNSPHIVLVATSFQKDTSLRKFVLESVSVIVQATLPSLFCEGCLRLRSVLAALAELD